MPTSPTSRSTSSVCSRKTTSTASRDWVQIKKGQPQGWPSYLHSHQTRQAFARTILCPALQPKAWANSDIFETTLSMRNTGSECGFVVTTSRATSGLTFEHQE